jgi:hypothetical protein
MPDLADPQVWWRRLVDAVAGLQSGSKVRATEYLQWVAEHRGRAVAEKSRKTLIALRDAPSWAGCRAWIANGYKPVRKPR